MPSAEEGARRRLSTFGTESKLVATTAVVAGAAALIAAPAIAAIPSVRAAGASALSATTKAVSNVVSAVPTKYKVAAVLSTPLITGAVVSNPKAAAALPGKFISSSYNFGGNLGDLASNPSLSNLQALAKENPVITGLAGAAGLLTVGAAARGVASIAATALNTSAVKASTAASVASSSIMSAGDTPLYPASVAGESSLVAPVTDSSINSPVLPVSKAASATRKKRKVPKEMMGRVSQSVRVNITDDRDRVDRKVYKQVR